MRQYAIVIIFCVRHNPAWDVTVFVRRLKSGHLCCVEGLKARFTQPHCAANVELAPQLSQRSRHLVSCPTIPRLRHTHTHRHTDQTSGSAAGGSLSLFLSNIRETLARKTPVIFMQNGLIRSRLSLLIAGKQRHLCTSQSMCMPY